MIAVPDTEKGSGGWNSIFSNRRGLIILYNFIRKEKISNSINNCNQVNPFFQKFLDPALDRLISSGDLSSAISTSSNSGVSMFGKYEVTKVLAS